MPLHALSAAPVASLKRGVLWCVYVHGISEGKKNSSIHDKKATLPCPVLPWQLLLSSLASASMGILCHETQFWTLWLLLFFVFYFLYTVFHFDAIHLFRSAKLASWCYLFTLFGPVKLLQYVNNSPVEKARQVLKGYRGRNLVWWSKLNQINFPLAN